MKAILEFGIRGGAHTDNLVIPSLTLASTLAAKIVMTYEADPLAEAARLRDWYMLKHDRRITWQSATHFVAITRLDGRNEGSASAYLWRKPAFEYFAKQRPLHTIR